MPHFKVSANQIKAIRIEDRKTWPTDMDVWVDLCVHRPAGDWEIPFYLTPEQIRALHKMIKKASAAKRRV